jgi:hypothetical protein
MRLSGLILDVDGCLYIHCFASIGVLRLKPVPVVVSIDAVAVLDGWH